MIFSLLLLSSILIPNPSSLTNFAWGLMVQRYGNKVDYSNLTNISWNEMIEDSPEFTKTDDRFLLHTTNFMISYCIQTYSNLNLFWFYIFLFKALCIDIFFWKGVSFSPFFVKNGVDSWKKVFNAQVRSGIGSKNPSLVIRTLTWSLELMVFSTVGISTATWRSLALGRDHS